ncbi:Hemolysin-III channel protein-like protein Izh2 [Coniochaeta hoffmannii]|uniref:Hemolysin-III channel protein-like protein Izh2 n=1 Tax=Coniochaeta hoffmannii TaxID=91930 RepID=A0AA38RK39_9PEZI|nr:Hemolysin-III channel protein-like protein Izh2 [Coniochaeta hoffmannii]
MERSTGMAAANSGELAVLNLYFVSVIIALLICAMCHSERALKLGKALELQGLVLMIWGATVPLIYHAFICDPDLRARYLTVTCSAALFCTFLNFQPSFSKARLQPFRILGFGFLSLSLFIPVIHSLAAYGLAVQTRRLALQWIVYTLICHTFCAAAFATDFPEKFFPRTFDILGASHQISHIMLLASAITYAFALAQQFDFVHGAAAACPVV